MKLGRQSEKILVVDDERTIRTPVKALLDRKDPHSGGEPVPEPSTIPLLASRLIGGAAPRESRRNTADICHKEIQ